MAVGREVRTRSQMAAYGLDAREVNAALQSNPSCCGLSIRNVTLANHTGWTRVDALRQPLKWRTRRDDQALSGHCEQDEQESCTRRPLPARARHRYL